MIFQQYQNSQVKSQIEKMITKGSNEMILKGIKGFLDIFACKWNYFKCCQILKNDNDCIVAQNSSI